MPEAQGFRRAFVVAYSLGILLCVVWPLIAQALVGTHLPPGFLGTSGLAEDLGYTFTGLVVLGALFVFRRARHVRAAFSRLDARQQVRVMALEILLYSAIFELSVLFGILYHGLGGPQADRYARTFIALGPIMFLVFVPRLGSWRKAAERREVPGLR